MIEIKPKSSEFSSPYVPLDEILGFYSVRGIELPPERPYCWSNSLQTLDGCLHFLDNGSSIPDIGLKNVDGIGHLYPADYRLLQASWMHSDAVLVSGECVRSEPEICCRITFNDLLDYRCKTLGKPEQPVQVILSKSGVFPLERPIFHQRGLKVWIFVAEEGISGLSERIAQSKRDGHPMSDIQLFPLAMHADANGTRMDLHKMLRQLKDMGTNYLDVSSGGKIINAFIDAGLLDEQRTTTVGQICGPLSNLGHPRPKLFPDDRNSYPPDKSPIVAWKGIRFLGDYFIFLRGVLQYRHV